MAMTGQRSVDERNGDRAQAERGKAVDSGDVNAGVSCASELPALDDDQPIDI